MTRAFLSYSTVLIYIAKRDQKLDKNSNQPAYPHSLTWKNTCCLCHWFFDYWCFIYTFGKTKVCTLLIYLQSTYLYPVKFYIIYGVYVVTTNSFCIETGQSVQFLFLIKTLSPLSPLPSPPPHTPFAAPPPSTPRPSRPPPPPPASPNGKKKDFVKDGHQENMLYNIYPHKPRF